MTCAKDLIPSPELRAEIERLATVVFKPKEAFLFRCGDEPSGIFLIRSGQVRLGLDCDTSVYPARILGPGAIVGLPATVAGNPYTLTAEVMQDSELAFVPRDLLVAALRSNIRLCFQIMDMLSGEIADIRAAFKRNGSRVRASA